jgi:hypothetical protein
MPDPIIRSRFSFLLAGLLLLVAAAASALYFTRRSAPSIVGAWDATLGSGNLIAKYEFLPDGSWMAVSLDTRAEPIFGRYSIDFGTDPIALDLHNLTQFGKTAPGPVRTIVLFESPNSLILAHSPTMFRSALNDTPAERPADFSGGFVRLQRRSSPDIAELHESTQPR